MLHSFIILDGHPNAFSPTVKTDPQPIDPTRNSEQSSHFMRLTPVFRTTSTSSAMGKYG